MFNIKQISAIQTEAEGKSVLSNPEKKQKKGSCFLELIYWRCAYLVFYFYLKGKVVVPVSGTG